MFGQHHSSWSNIEPVPVGLGLWDYHFRNASALLKLSGNCVRFDDPLDASRIDYSAKKVDQHYTNIFSTCLYLSSFAERVAKQENNIGSRCRVRTNPGKHEMRLNAVSLLGRRGRHSTSINPTLGVNLCSQLCGAVII